MDLERRDCRESEKRTGRGARRETITELPQSRAARPDCARVIQETVEERLVAGALRDALRGQAREVGVEGRYDGVAGYDPVLRSHCRLGGNREKA